MDASTKILLGAMLAVGLLVLGFLLQPTIEEHLAPELVAARVAIEVDGSGVGVVGPVEIEVGTPFRLHAVVEAEGPVYYTEATALRLDGAEVPGEQLRAWRRPLEPRIRWFTVEGNPPYLEITSAADLERFRFEELFRADWSAAWSVPGVIEPARDDHLQENTAAAGRPFGTQRYHVSVDFFDIADTDTPKKRVRSWNGRDLPDRTEAFPTVHRLLPGRLAPASRVFGLTQLELAASAPAPGSPGAELVQSVDDLARRHLAFTRATVVRDQLGAAGKRLEQLAWRDVDLVAGDGRWGATAQPGDLLRVGERLVVLYEDRGVPGVLDYEDLCFDYARGAEVRELGEVFTGAGLVEVATLGDTG